MAEYDADKDNYKSRDGSTHYSEWDATQADLGRGGGGYNMASDLSNFMDARRAEKRAEERRPSKAAEARAKAMKALHKMAVEQQMRYFPNAWDLYQKGEYVKALRMLEICNQFINPPRKPVYGVYKLPEEFTPKGFTPEDLQKAVSECYLKASEEAETEGDYIKALHLVTIANAYHVYKKNETDNSAPLTHIGNLMDKLCPKAESGDEEALRALMNVLYHSVVITDSPALEEEFKPGEELPDFKFTGKIYVSIDDRGMATEDKFPRPVELCIKLAKQNNPTALVLLANHYEKGKLGLNVFQKRWKATLRLRRKMYKKARKAGYKYKDEIKMRLESVARNLYPGFDDAKNPVVSFIFAVLTTAAFFLAGLILQEHGINLDTNLKTMGIVAGSAFLAHLILFNWILFLKTRGPFLMLLLCIAGVVVLLGYKEGVTKDDLLDIWQKLKALVAR
jgi:tetratricopeptide (TPR) repeat protein